MYERLLREAVQRRELSPAAVSRIQDLMQHGVTLEQAVVGTGLVSFQTFVEWMREATGLTVLTALPQVDQKLFPPGLDLATIAAWQVIPEKTGDKAWTVALTEPQDPEIRTALEAIAAEQGWTLTFAYAPRSLAERWFEALEAQEERHHAFLRFTRTTLAQALREKQLALTRGIHALHPHIVHQQVPAAWLSALALRLARRGERYGVDIQHQGAGRRSEQILLRSRATSATAAEGDEHPLQDWSRTLHGHFETGSLVFLLDPDETLLVRHVSHAPHDHADLWRAGQRWIAAAKPELQEELFHLALAGFPGTICFSSPTALQSWERAATDQSVPYTVCLGQPTGQGTAWSLYTV